jgi:hypothetical protein
MQIGNLNMMTVMRLTLMQLNPLFGRKPHLAQEPINVAFGHGDLELVQEMLAQPIGRPPMKAITKVFGAMGDEMFEPIEIGLIDRFRSPNGLGWGIDGRRRSGLISVLTLGHRVILLTHYFKLN